MVGRRGRDGRPGPPRSRPQRQNARRTERVCVPAAQGGGRVADIDQEPRQRYRCQFGRQRDATRAQFHPAARARSRRLRAELGRVGQSMHGLSVLDTMGPLPGLVGVKLTQPRLGRAAPALELSQHPDDAHVAALPLPRRPVAPLPGDADAPQHPAQAQPRAAGAHLPRIFGAKSHLAAELKPGRRDIPAHAARPPERSAHFRSGRAGARRAATRPGPAAAARR